MEPTVPLESVIRRTRLAKKEVEVGMTPASDHAKQLRDLFEVALSGAGFTVQRDLLTPRYGVVADLMIEPVTEYGGDAIARATVDLTLMDRAQGVVLAVCRKQLEQQGIDSNFARMRLASHMRQWLQRHVVALLLYYDDRPCEGRR